MFEIFHIYFCANYVILIALYPIDSMCIITVPKFVFFMSKLPLGAYILSPNLLAFESILSSRYLATSISSPQKFFQLIVSKYFLANL